MGDPEQAIAAARRALDMARAEGDVELEVLATTYLGLAFYTRADHAQAMEHFRANVARLRGELEGRLLGMAQLPAVHSRAWLAACLADLGQLDEAEDRAREAAAIAERAQHPLSRAVAQWSAGYIALRRGRPDAAVGVLEQSFARMREWSIG